jgi:hypothetical protein
MKTFLNLSVDNYYVKITKFVLTIEYQQFTSCNPTASKKILKNIWKLICHYISLP